MPGGNLLLRSVAWIAAVSLAGCFTSHPPSTDAGAAPDAPTRALYGTPCDGCEIAYADGFTMCVPTPSAPTARCADCWPGCGEIPIYDPPRLPSCPDEECGCVTGMPVCYRVLRRPAP